MKKKSLSADQRNYMFKNFLFIIYISVLISGCSSHGRYYFYDGNPLPATQVAYVHVHDTLTMINFNTIPMRVKKLTTSFDILPGKHTLDLTFSSMSYSAKTVSSGTLSTIELNAQPGHIYYIYPSFPTHDSWRPKAIDISKAEDLSTIPPYVWDATPVPDENKKSYILTIKKNFEQHFQAQQNHCIRVSESKYWE